MHLSYLMNQFSRRLACNRTISHISMMLSNVRLVKDTSSSYPEKESWRRGWEEREIEMKCHSGVVDPS